MQVPLQIAFHKVEKSDWAEREIRARVDRLTKLYNKVVGASVTVDQRATNVEGTIPPVVRIELSMPGAAPVVVAYEPERLQRRFQSPDLRNAINDAFESAERQLAGLKDQRTGRPEQLDHEARNQFLGQIAEMHPEEDHGFLITKEGSLLYFHRNSVLSEDFDELKRGDEVHYVEQMGDTGPAAAKVRTPSR
ncbi:HPF/RaiA family ribosome-associated protein [Aquamicrobium sp. LC103]|uniref:HPF/RaiA family ribosome-associated protein n=1 Tax=Aquamicrobium sp. LC103 TaxID=1120658 RepID=UPI00063EA08E|nr:HPF/RaiA family ribosome-associated protein [Aquamicrobium sp. LC103]TKT69716.1 HPF/RaiA family ribosome-associated protein [Aquamicrobium sp. LC103]